MMMGVITQTTTTTFNIALRATRNRRARAMHSHIRNRITPTTTTTAEIVHIPSDSCGRWWKRQFSSEATEPYDRNRSSVSGGSGDTSSISNTNTNTYTTKNIEKEKEEDRPTGTLFQLSKVSIGPELVGARGMIRRTFGPRSNAEGLLATGGPDLAAHASFDPNYHRAQDWIRHHAVGPAVLSPILIAGLTGALTEAAFPHGVITYQSMKHVRPLIVGVPVASIIEVLTVTKAERMKDDHNEDHLDDPDPDVDQPSETENEHDQHRQQRRRKHGYDVTLRTIVSRVRDDCIIAEGTHELWVPDYLHM